MAPKVREKNNINRNQTQERVTYMPMIFMSKNRMMNTHTHIISCKNQYENWMIKFIPHSQPIKSNQAPNFAHSVRVHDM